MLFKNTASQGVYCFMIDSGTGEGKTGDASNISVTISLDGGATSASSNSVSEIGGGVYTLTLTQGETNADRVAIIPSSSTASVVGSPIIAFTTGGAVPAAAAGASTGLALTSSVDDVETKIDTVDSVADGIATTLGTAGAGLTDVGGMSTGMKAEVNAEVDTALGDYDAPTKAEMDAKFSTTDALITTVDGVADGIATTLGTAGAGLTDLGGMSTGMKAEVNTEVDTALSDYDAPTKAEMDSKFSTTDGLITTVDGVADGIATTLGTAGAGLTELGGMSTGMKAEVNAEVDTALTDYDAPTKAEMDAKFSTTDGLISTVDTVVDSISSTLSSGVTVASISDGAIGADAVADIWSTTALAESYASDGSTGTGAQLLYQIQQALTEFAISSTTLTVKRLDGSTTASTYTLDDASSPTSRTRAS